MATFISLATCPLCPIRSSRRRLLYTDSMFMLSRRLQGPRGSEGPGALGGRRLPARLHRVARPDLPACITASRAKPAGGMKHLVLTHLGRLLMFGSAHRGGRACSHPVDL
ncbi:uncharacterized protein LOC107834467 isoform X2 [Poecilia formosa]|uniref:uncharacterized protein LOC107834467 isoform X2 n=1 Tax=Poecilia formosa TaxID=48698 RepID=UPI0007BA2C3F|nr:PREDICTED: uncharacterized protein LOC107834467 isoform X2 [Poecilia formosa]